jgi:phosphohistidine phosphatase
MKAVYAMRHAKSSWSDPGLADFDRPLAPRGIKAARKMARILNEADPRPTVALCSTAVRVTQTYDVMTKQLDYKISPSFLDDLYGAGATTLLRYLRDVPEDVKAVLLIAHNPGIQELVISLTEYDGEGAAQQVRLKFPTAAVATLRIEGDWAQLGPRQTTLERFDAPRGREGAD